jgi:hypothetical protein
MIERLIITDGIGTTHRVVKKAVQQGRSERRDEAYSVLYVEALSDARTRLADFFTTLQAADCNRNVTRLFMRVRDETAETPGETGAWSREGERHP